MKENEFLKKLVKMLEAIFSFDLFLFNSSKLIVSTLNTAFTSLQVWTDQPTKGKADQAVQPLFNALFT